MAREGLTELAERIRAHPRFPAATLRAVEEFVEWRVRLGVLNKIISNFARERIVEHLLYLHFAREGGRGATFERLAALSESRDGIGARAVRTALRLAQIGGHAILTRSREDGRLRIYEPTDALIGEVANLYAILFGVLEDLAPGLSVRERLRREPDFLPGVLARIGRVYLSQAPRASGERDAYASLLRLEGARPILATVVERHLTRRDLPTAPDLARRFYVSASQTRAVMKSAELFGLMRTGERGRLIDAAALTEAHSQRFSVSIAFLALHALPNRIDIPDA